MITPARIQGHPVHPMLIPFPIALWIFSLIADVIYRLEWGGPVWSDVAFFTMVGGVLGALLAALPGYLDYRSLTDPQVRRIGQWHMGLNLSIAVLFAVNAGLRVYAGPDGVWPVLLSIVGVGLVGISGWLGGDMVYVHGVAVEPQAGAGKRGDHRAA